MFTGLIEDVGTVKNISQSRISIETKLDSIATGGSISVNGVCLTAVCVNEGFFTADYSPHTDKITNLSSLKNGAKVNLERALQLSSRLGGHIVSGHVDGTAKIEKIEKADRFFKITFSCPANITKYCIDKGSIAVDGISLTVSSLNTSKFDVYIIPETFENTVLKYKKTGDKVNIENDIMAKYIEKFVNNKNGGRITLDMLKENGF
ncbi:MAG: riboflavin synthase [Endomicrobia bacterium]|nr:riboflavin synthase [Endomicrobiia bacterium]